MCWWSGLPPGRVIGSGTGLSIANDTRTAGLEIIHTKGQPTRESGGVARVLSIPLNQTEKEGLTASAGILKQNITMLDSRKAAAA
jgi:hypothetical protein